MGHARFDPAFVRPGTFPATELLVLSLVVVAEAGILFLGLSGADPLLSAWIALAGAYFLLSIRAPEAAWLVAFVAVPFSWVELPPWGGAISVPTEPMLVIALAGWGVRALTGAVPLRRSPAHLPLAFLAAAALLSVLLGSFVALGLKAWLAMGGYAAFGYLYFSCTKWNGHRRDRWVRTVSVLGALIGLYGAVRVLALGVSAGVAYGAARPFFLEHGTYSAYLGLLLPIPLFAALEGRGAARVAYAAAAFSIAIGILLSFTRAAWIASAIVLPVALWLWSSRRGAARPLLIPTTVGIGLVLLVLGTGAGDRLWRHAESVTQSENVSNLERINRWMAAWEMFRDRPVTGTGFDSFGAAYPAFRRKSIVTDQVYQRMGTHNEALRLLSETGVIGFAAGLWFFGTVVVIGIRAFRRLPDPATGSLVLACLAGIVTYCVHSLFNAYLGIDKVTLPFWVELGMIAGLYSSSRDMSWVAEEKAPRSM